MQGTWGNGPFQPQQPKSTGPFGGKFNAPNTNPRIAPKYDPCTNQRDTSDIAGRLGDAMNCYVIGAGQYVQHYLPLVIVAIILVAIMLIAAREVLK